MKFFSKIVLLLLLASCSKVGPRVVTRNDRSGDKIESVEQIAQNVYRSFYGEETKSTGLDISSVLPVRDSTFFVVDFENAGYVILQNNEEKTPVVVIENGDYQNNDVPVAQLIIDSMMDQLGGFDFPDDTMMIVRLLRDTTEVAPLISVNWHQGCPFNLYAPNGIAGCGPVSIAQAMSVFSSPSSIALTYPGADSPTTYLNWDQMAIHGNNSNNAHDAASCFYCQQCGHLLRQIGHICNASYNPSSTSINANQPVSTYNTFGYTTDIGLYDLDNIIESLDDGYPTILSARDSLFYGHGFNVDGYHRIAETYMLKIRENGVWVSSTNFKHEYVYFHVNYGWGGSHNGYYLALYRQLLPNNIVYVDSFNGYRFNDVFLMHYNIHPIYQ